MAIDIMMQLGWFQFSIDSAAYQELTHQTAWRWPSQPQIGQRDAYQFTGKSGETINLTGTIYVEFRYAGARQIDAMRTMADRGQPLRLVDGMGGIHGLWVITSIRERQPSHLHFGVPRKQEFEMQLTKSHD